jgi:hypothetical protein
MRDIEDVIKVEREIMAYFRKGINNRLKEFRIKISDLLKIVKTYNEILANPLAET